jgi:hypothetical protein
MTHLSFNRLLGSVVILSLTANTLSSCGRPSTTSTHLLDAANEATARARLATLKNDIALLQKTVHKSDSARLFIIARHVDASIQLMNDRGVVNMQTMYSLQKLVMQFIYAEMFFQFIRTENNSAVIDRVLSATIAVGQSSIRTDIGYDDPRGSILADNLDVIVLGLQALLTSTEVPDADKVKIKPMIAAFGSSLALARAQGDRPFAFADGMKRCDEMDAIYPLFDKYTGTTQLFGISQSIRGTNEFLKEYLQVALMRNTGRSL